MSTNGETADMVVRESIQITESAVKLAGLGAKNLAALLVAVAKDNPKLSGKTGLKRLIQDGEELAIFSVKQEDLRGFQMESIGTVFCSIPLSIGWRKPAQWRSWRKPRTPDRSTASLNGWAILRRYGRMTPQKKRIPALGQRAASESAGMVPERLPRWISHPCGRKCWS